MPIISVEIMKTIDEKKKCKKKKKKIKQTQKGTRGRAAICKTKWFCCAFKLGFFLLISKASLIFKSNSEFALSIILKQRGFYEAKHVVVECRCLKIWDLLSFLICSSIPVLKWWQVSPI